MVLKIISEETTFENENTSMCLQVVKCFTSAVDTSSAFFSVSLSLRKQNGVKNLVVIIWDATIFQAFMLPEKLNFWTFFDDFSLNIG